MTRTTPATPATPATSLPTLPTVEPTYPRCYLGDLRADSGSLTLTDVTIEARITGLFVHVTLHQRFVNRYDTPLEATYVLGLPDRLAAHRFQLIVGDRVVAGKVLERAEAREAYDSAVDSGTRAAIAEEERPGTFTLRVGRIAPGEAATANITLIGPLAIEGGPTGGEATLRFPLTVAPRYTPGHPVDDPTGTGTHPDTDLVPDASRVTPPMRQPGEPSGITVRATVDIHRGNVPLHAPTTSLPSATTSTEDGWRITLQPGQEPNADLVVRLPLRADELHCSGWIDGDSAAVWVVPPASTARRAKDVVVLLDRSGSMEGWKLVAARRAAARLVDALGADDRFAVAAFDNEIDTPPDLGLTAAIDRQRFRATTWLGQIGARGGTELTRALDWALDLLHAHDADGADGADRRNRERERDRVLLLVTDAQISDEDNALATAGQRLDGVRVLSVVVDSAPNAAFLRRLAGPNGRVEAVETEDRLDAVLSSLARDIASPALLDARIGGVTDLVGAGDVFTGAPAFLAGRVTAGATSVTVTATLPDGRPWSAQVPLVQGGPEIRFGWARGRLRDLEDRYVAHPGSVDADDIVRLSVAEQVLCRFTALLAVDDSGEKVEGTMRRVDQPVTAPQGWAMSRPSMPMPMSMPVPGATIKRSMRRKADYINARRISAPALDQEAFGAVAGRAEKALIPEAEMSSIRADTSTEALQLDAEQIPASAARAEAERVARSRADGDRADGDRADRDRADRDRAAQLAREARDSAVVSLVVLLDRIDMAIAEWRGGNRRALDGMADAVRYETRVSPMASARPAMLAWTALSAVIDAVTAGSLSVDVLAAAASELRAAHTTNDTHAKDDRKRRRFWR